MGSSGEEDMWMGQPLKTKLPGRWDRGREWNGLPTDWCDPVTAEEGCREAERVAMSGEDMNLTQFMAHMMPYYKNKRALTYLDGKGREIESQSFSEVYTYSSRIAAYLQREIGLRPGDRAVLLYPPGQEFILAFIGCIRAGVIAVPVYPPHPYRFETDVPRLNLIVKNSGCKVALTDSQYILVIRSIAVKNIFSRVGLGKTVTWPSLRNVQTDKVRTSYAHTDLLEEPQPRLDDVMFLQYTSGSTSAPKGVMVTHRNGMAQMRVIGKSTAHTFGYSNNQNVVSWLPQYHDMGLIGMFLTCLCNGAHLIYMTPITFLQDPTQWLRACDKYRATATCAPNFAFALTQRKTPPELRDSLDLTSVKVVVCGAEPIRVEVMASFNEYFKPSGYDPKALSPSYGLAEFTLCATTQLSGSPLNVVHVDQVVLGAEGKVVLVNHDTPGAACYVGVGCPFPEDGSVCKIVNPDTREDLGEDRVGEIWLDGPSKTLGYFADPEKTAAAFHGVIKGQEDSGHVYLQTGDQGFIHDGQLFITGRIKDLIIVRGRNLYPQDVEYTVEEALLELLRPGCSGAFSYDHEGEETVAYVAELREKVTDTSVLKEAVEKIRRVVADVFQVSVSAVVLVEPRTIPKTTSGKIQRHKCKDGFHHGGLKENYRWVAAGGDQYAQDLDDHEPVPLASMESYASYFSTRAFSELVDASDVEDLVASGGRLSSQTSWRREQPAFENGVSSALLTIAEHPPADGTHVEEVTQVPTRCGQVDKDGRAVSPEEAAATAEYTERLVSYVMKARGIPMDAVDIDAPMSLLGFDSAGFVALGKVMGDWVGKEIPPVIVYKYTTIREVAGFLARGADESELTAGVADDAIEVDLDAPIAIVGMGCKAPGGVANGNLVGKDALWRFVLDGKDAVREDMPSERKVGPHAGNKLPGAYLDHIDTFDASFFGFSPAEASHLDYHQCQVLEMAWHALEDAGIDSSTLSGRMVGVYVGAISHEFAVLQALRGEESTFAATGLSNSLIANRVSYVLNVRGPSVVVDTACSSSLVAIHDAVRDLRLGACSMAVAGGVNLVLNSEASAALKRAGFLASACRTFDAAAEGYCRGEGCGMVVLKRLDRALAEGDRVYAVIRGSAVDHDGRTTSLTAPNPLAQEAVLKAAYRDAKVDPKQVTYIEAHGTGTRLGDSIEMSALGAVMAGRDKANPCIIASAKSNIGHLEAAAGVLGLIRAALILHHRLVPKAVHFDTPNPLIPWDRLPFKVPTTNLELTTEDPGQTFLAGVSSFGFGGTNSHVVLESMPRTFDDDDFEVIGDDQHPHGTTTTATPSTVVSSNRPSPAADALPLLLPISAKSESALRALAHSYTELLGSKGVAGRYDRAMQVCMDASTHRQHYHGYRLAAVGRSTAELRESIHAKIGDASTTFTPVSNQPQSPEVCFLYTGQGAGYLNMAKQLYEKNAIFRASMDECEEYFVPLLNGASVLRDVVLIDAKEPVTRTLLTQPTLFAIEYAMTRIWTMMGVEPQVVMGHSVGEVVAAVLAGCMTLEDGAKLICTRAKAMDEQPEGVGGITVVFAARDVVDGVIEEAQWEMEPRLEVSAINGDACINVSGPLPGLDALEAALNARSIRFTRLSVSHAFHSSAMDPALPAIRDVAQTIAFKRPRVRLISLITGAELKDAPEAEHWCNGVRKPVLFLDGVKLLTEGSRPRVVIEMGPDAALTGMARRSVPSDAPVAWIASMTKARRDDENLRVTEAFASAYVAGVNLKFKALRVDQSAPLSTDLPLYPFDPTVYVSLGQLTEVGVARLQGTAAAAASDLHTHATTTAGVGSFNRPLPRRDYGTTNLFEESWLPRVVDRGHLRAHVMPPGQWVYVCSDAMDAAAILAALSCTTKRKRACHVVVPLEVEGRVREVLRTRWGGSQDLNAAYDMESLVGIDFQSATDMDTRLKEVMRGPAGSTVNTAVAFIASGAHSASAVETPSGVSSSASTYMTLSDAAYEESGRLLVLFRALVEMGVGDRVRMWVVTCRAKAAVAGDRVCNLGSALWSLTKSALMEGWSLWATLMDLPGQTPPHTHPALLPSSLVHTIKKEATAAAMRLVSLLDHDYASYTPTDHPEQLAYRQGTWYVMRLRRAWLEAEMDRDAYAEGKLYPDVFPPPDVDVHMRQTLNRSLLSRSSSSGEEGEGWYLVTGGLGGLGMHCAAALVRHGARRLILTSRRGVVPERYQKDLELLESTPGVTIKCVGCDAMDREAVFRLFDETPGGIRGVVHAAGVLIDGNLRTQSWEKLNGVWRGKVEGAINLHEASLRQPRPLDIFVMYSSSSALMGSPGEANYAAANAALDSLAYLRRQQRLACTSIQWGSWLGIGFAQPAFLERLAESGFPAITTSLGSLVLTTLLNHSASAAPTVVCCHPVEWNLLVLCGPQYMLECDLSCFPAVKERVEPAHDAQAALTNEMRAYGDLDGSEARTKMIEDVLIGEIQKASNKNVTRTQNLSDIGMASLEAVELVERLRRMFPVNIELARLAEFPTVEGLATYIMPQLDRIVDANRSLPLSVGQHQAVAAGLGRAFLYIEQKLTSPSSSRGIATSTLLSAWSHLLTRHEVLRTVIDLSTDTAPLTAPHPPTHTHTGRQRTLSPSDVTVGDTFATLPDCGAARDLGPLEEVLGSAANRMSTVPPARLVLSDAAGVVYIAVSRVLMDGYTLRLLASELCELYRHLGGGGGGVAGGDDDHRVLTRTRVSFTEEIRRMVKDVKRPSTTESATTTATSTAASDGTGASAVASMNGDRGQNSAQALIKTESGTQLPPLIRGLSRKTSESVLIPAGAVSAGSQLETLTLPPDLSMDLDTYAIKHKIPASVVLLTAYILTLADGSPSTTSAQMVIDVDQTCEHPDILGPVSMPIIMQLDRTDMTDGVQQLTRTLHARLHDGLSKLMIPAPAAATGSGGDASYAAPTFSHSLPGFAYSEVLSGEIGVIGGVRPPQALQLAVQASLASTGGHTKYDLKVSTGPYYAMSGLETLPASVVENVRGIVSGKGTAVARERGRGGGADGGVHVEAVEEGEERGDAEQRHAVLPWAVAGLLQLLGLMLMGVVLILPVMLVWPALQLSLDYYGAYPTLAMTPLAIHVIGLLMCGFTLLLRQVFTRGWLPEGRYPINSLPYLRWWFMTRLVSLLGPTYTDHIRGTFLYTWWLRGLGATIGTNVRLLNGVQLTDPDMTIVEDDAVCGRARLVGSIVRNGVLHRGEVVVERRANLGTHAVMLPGSRASKGAMLKPLSVAAEGQVLTENGVFEGSPAYFVKPRQDIGTFSQRRRTRATIAFGIIAQFLSLFLGPILGCVAAGMAYALFAMMAEEVGIYPYFNWSTWSAGPVLMALYTSFGMVPMLAFPTLLAFMTFVGRAKLLPDAMLRLMAAADNLNIAPKDFRNLFNSEFGINAIRGGLPSGVELLGTAGSDDLHFKAGGWMAVPVIGYKGLIIPTINEWGIIGVLWAFVVGFILQGIIATALTTLAYHVLLAPTRSTTPRRVRGYKSMLRQVKVSTLRYQYDRFMRLFAGTDILPSWYWILGMKVGPKVILGNLDVIEDPHLVSIGDNAIILDFAVLDTCVDPGNGYAIMGPVRVGKDGFVGVRSVLGPGVEMAAGAVVMPQSCVEGGNKVERDAVMLGVPATKAVDRAALTGQATADEEGGARAGMSVWGVVWEWVVGRGVKGVVVPLVIVAFNLMCVVLAAFPPAVFMMWVMDKQSADSNVLETYVFYSQLTIPLVYLIFSGSLLVLVVATKWLFRLRVRDGSSVTMRGFKYFARTATMSLQTYAAGATFNAILGSVWAPVYYMLLGASVHPTAYINTHHITDADLLHVDDHGVLDTDATVMPIGPEATALRMGTVKISENARMGVNSVVFRNTLLQPDSELADAAFLPPTMVVRTGTKRWGATLTEEAGEVETGATREGMVVVSLKA